MNRRAAWVAVAALLGSVVLVPSAAAWTWPLRGAVLETFSFDPTHPYASGQHRGIAIRGDAGAPVVAPASGVVTFAGTVPSNGLSVTIQTDDGLAATLTHLGAVSVARGATVREGDAVGTVGPSGTAEFDVPYVHLGIRASSNPEGYLDPLSFLPAPDQPAPPPSAAPTPVASPVAAPPAAPPVTQPTLAAPTPAPAPAPGASPPPLTTTPSPSMPDAPAAAAPSLVVERPAGARSREAVPARTTVQTPASTAPVASPAAVRTETAPGAEVTVPARLVGRAVWHPAGLAAEQQPSDAARPTAKATPSTRREWTSPRSAGRHPRVLPLVLGLACLAAGALCLLALRRRLWAARWSVGPAARG